MRLSRIAFAPLISVLVSVGLVATAAGQTPPSTESVYRTPSQVLVDIIDSPLTPYVLSLIHI